MRAVYWLAQEEREHKLEYVEQTALIKVHSHHATAGLYIERTLVVHPEKDILINQVTISNVNQKPLHCQLVAYVGFNFDHRFTKNCCFFEKENNALTFFATDRYVQVMLQSTALPVLNTRTSSFTILIKDKGEATNTRLDR